MWTDIVRQVLAVTWAMLGAWFGLVLSLLFVEVTRRVWQILSILVIVNVGLIAYVLAERRRLEQRAEVVGQEIHRAIDRAVRLERGYRNGEYSSDQTGPLVEAWRNRVDGYLKRALPKSGAARRFRSGVGEGSSYNALDEYTRLLHLKSNLTAILDALPSYVKQSRRSRSR